MSQTIYTKTVSLPRPMTGLEIKTAFEKSAGKDFRKGRVAINDGKKTAPFGAQSNSYPYGLEVMVDKVGTLLSEEDTYQVIVVKNVGGWGGVVKAVRVSDATIIEFCEETIKKFLESLKASSSFRNPFTPSENEVFTPIEYLKRSLEFRKWNTQNPITHRPDCIDKAHHEVMVDGMCCIQHLQQCIEGTLLDVAGCKAGVFIEPKGYRKWLTLAQLRLVELLSGHDYLDQWTQVLKESEFYSWIWEQNIDYHLRPGFSLESFKVACIKHGYEPDMNDVAITFHATREEIVAFWAIPEKI
jgi:hypothetical protein